jgi:imidazoleglycerol-phosphate dehydratase
LALEGGLALVRKKPGSVMSPNNSMANVSTPRRATVSRKTRETEVRLTISLDGTGESRIDTGVPFLDHMLTLLAKHGRMDLQVTAKGDLAVDYHHLVEDSGIVLGRAIRAALGDGKGIERFGHAIVPIDEALALTAVDISGRGFLHSEKSFTEGWVRDFDLGLLEEFFRAFAVNAGVTLHIRVLSGVNPHHRAEAVFKSLARSLRDAVSLDSSTQDVPSTKGVLQE